MYKKAVFELVEFDVEDVIVTSGTSSDQTGGIPDEWPADIDHGTDNP